MSLDQAISATLMADPKIRAGLEAIHQANADWLTSSLPPNPTLITDGIFLPLRPITPAQAGRADANWTCKWDIPSTGFCSESARRRWPAPVWACVSPRPITPT